MSFVELETLNKESVAWRYVTFVKFLSLLEDQALHFSSLAKLERLDPHEGHFTDFSMLVINHFQREYENQDKIWLQKWGIADKEQYELQKARLATIYYERSLGRVASYVNCWHVNDIESANMWNSYLNNNSEGLAIKTKISSIIESFECLENVYGGMVTYVQDDEIDFNTKFPEMCYRKRKCFEYENELRFAVQGGGLLDANMSNDGKKIKVNVLKLMPEVCLAPWSLPWFEKLVRDVLNRYGLNEIKIIPSKIMAKPRTLLGSPPG